MRERLLRRYVDVRAATEALAAPLSAEDQLLQSMPDTSPTKWHRAHTTWFFEEFVLGPRGAEVFDPRYRYLYNSYYEAVGPRHPRPRRGMVSRPSLADIAAYRRAVDARMAELLRDVVEADLLDLAPLVELGLAHEEQHQELLLTDIVHAFSESPLRPALRDRAPSLPCPAPASDALTFAEHEGGLVELGCDAGPVFCFDNESPRHRVFLEPYAIARRPITVGEVRAFVEARGYETPSLWLAEGYDRVQAGSGHAPALLRFDGGQARVFGVDGERDAREDEPAAHLDFYEADAVARFLGGRLPTEAEWENAARGVDPSAGNFWQGGLDGGALRPLPAPAGAEVAQLFGDVWEWTSSAYAPYPGFRAAPGAVGEYNGKFMVNQYVLRGGSCFSPRGHLRASYRNFWRPQTTFQVTGARVARSLH